MSLELVEVRVDFGSLCVCIHVFGSESGLKVGARLDFLITSSAAVDKCFSFHNPTGQTREPNKTFFLERTKKNKINLHIA